MISGPTDRQPSQDIAQDPLYRAIEGALARRVVLAELTELASGGAERFWDCGVVARRVQDLCDQSPAITRRALAELAENGLLERRRRVSRHERRAYRLPPRVPADAEAAH